MRGLRLLEWCADEVEGDRAGSGFDCWRSALRSELSLVSGMVSVTPSDSCDDCRASFCINPSRVELVVSLVSAIIDSQEVG